jgi:prevent-host-death family protein
MGTINIHEAKTHLSRLVDEAAAGKEIVIAKAGKPMARLTPYNKPARRKLGGLKGLKIRDDFDAPLPDDVICDFEGECV